MGAYTPLDWAPTDLVDRILTEVARPTVDEMARRGPLSPGSLCGLALTPGGLRVVEFNARFGDPEIQAVLRLLDSSLGELLSAAADGRLAEVDPPQWRDGAAVCGDRCAGYPGDVISGDPVQGIDRAEGRRGLGRACRDRFPRQVVVTSGGRVLSVTAVGDTLPEALRRAYEGVGPSTSVVATTAPTSAPAGL